MHFGLIGGIGPAATVTYYKRLYEEFKAAGVPLELTIVHADVAKMGENARSKDLANQAGIFARHTEQLAGAGCDVAMITALTGHFCFDETKALSPIPMIDAIALVDDYCAKKNIGTLGLLGSTPVLESHLFGRLRSVETVVPRNKLAELGDTYTAVANSGICTDQDRHVLFAAGAEMVTEQKAEAVLLAGTDLGLAFGGHDPGYRVIDALEIHVAALLDMAR